MLGKVCPVHQPPPRKLCLKHLVVSVWVLTADVSTITDDPRPYGEPGELSLWWAQEAITITLVPKTPQAFQGLRLVPGGRLIRVVVHRHPSHLSVTARSMDHRSRSHRPFRSNQRHTIEETWYQHHHPYSSFCFFGGRLEILANPVFVQLCLLVFNI